MLDLEREPDRSSDASSDLDLIDQSRLGRVDELERGVATVQQYDLALVAAPIGDLRETQRVAVERHCLLVVLDGEDDSKFGGLHRYRRGSGERRGGGAGDLLVRDVADVLGDVPAVAEGVRQLAVAFSPELVGELVVSGRARGDGLLPE